MGCLSAQRFLDSITTAEWLEWVEYQKIRGPIGLDRWDYYVKLIALHAGNPYPEGKAPTIADLPMPWDPEPAAATTKPDEDEQRQLGPIFIPQTARRSRTGT